MNIFRIMAITFVSMSYLRFVGMIQVTYDNKEHSLVTIKNNCSTYFQNLHPDKFIEVAKTVLKRCKVQPHIRQFTQTLQTCIVQIQYNAESMHILRKKVCTKELDLFHNNLFALAWGTEWGCPKGQAKIQVHEYYTIHIHVPSVFSMGLETQVEGECVVPSLLFENHIKLSCVMNQYGGYQWKIKVKDQCYFQEFNNASLQLMDRLKTSPVYCSIRIFLLYVQMAQCAINSCPKNKPFELTRRLVTECTYQESWVSEATRLDLYKMVDIVLSEQYWRERNIAQAIDSIRSVLFHFSNILSAYFLQATAAVYQRGAKWKFVIARYLPQKTMQCDEYYKMTFLKVTPPVTVLCTKRIHFIESTPIFGMYVALAFLLVKSTYHEFFDIQVNFTLPPFHQSGNYLCVVYESTIQGILNDKFDGCEEVQATLYNVVCRCKHPGVYMLLQDRPPDGRDRGQIVNIMNQVTTSMIHTAVVSLLLLGLVLHISIRHSQRALKLYAGERWSSQHALQLCTGENRRIQTTKSFLDLAIHEHIFSIIRLIVQLAAIQITADRNCPIIGSLTHTLCFILGFWNVVFAVTLFAATRSYNLYRLVVVLSVFTYAAGVVLCIALYGGMSFQYYAVNCLPQNMRHSMTYPLIVVNAIAGVVNLIYWIFRPYKNLDEWFGRMGNISISLFVWSSMIHARPPANFASRSIIRLSQLTLFQGMYIALYHMFLKFSMLRFYWILILKRQKTMLSQTEGTENTQNDERPMLVIKSQAFKSEKLKPAIDDTLRVSTITEDIQYPSKQAIKVTRKHTEVGDLPTREQLRKAYRRRVGTHHKLSQAVRL